jgi:hypothetical protein
MFQRFLLTSRAALAASAVLAIVACGAFDSQENEFPDAGPGGPDSVYAGVGLGIPFGEFGLPADRFQGAYTGAVVPVSRSNVGSVLKAAQAARLRLVLRLAGPDRYRNADGTFDLARWKAEIDTYRDVDFAPWVDEGLILAHFLIDEPGARRTWGGREVSRADVEEMARYSKSIWPSLPTAVRAPPDWLRAGDTSYASLDIAWAQWAALRRSAAGRTPEQYRDENVAEAKQLGLGLIFGLNFFNGGDGTSETIGISGNPGLFEMSAGEIVRVGTLLASAPYACAFLSWGYDPSFEDRPDVRAALDSLAVVTSGRGATSCVRH